MTRAIEGRWGKSQQGPEMFPGSRAWAFRMANGALTPAPAAEGVGGPTTAAALASLGPGEALVYNAPLHDIASLVTV